MSKRWAGDPYYDEPDDDDMPDAECPWCGVYHDGERGALCPTCYEEQENARDYIDEGGSQ